MIKVKSPHLSDQFGQVVLVQPFVKSPDMVYTLAHDDAVFSKMAAKRVDQLRPLSDEQITGTKEHGPGLLLCCLHSHCPHGGTLSGLSDCLRISDIILLSLDLRLHIDRSDEPNLMAEPGKFSAPAVRRSAGLHGHNTWGQRSNELRELRPR